MVIIPANTLVHAHAHITAASPYLSEIGANIMEPIKAPALPLAAQIPFRVDRHSGENVMDGSINVVVFGP